MPHDHDAPPTKKAHPLESATHKYWAVECFNRCWTLIEKVERTPDEDRQMLYLTMASNYHWSQREDCKPSNESIGAWQLSRVYALIGDAANALKWAERCAELCEQHDLEDWQQAFVHEAKARAYHVAGDLEKRDTHLRKGIRLGSAIGEAENKEIFLNDLKTVPGYEEIAAAGVK